MKKRFYLLYGIMLLSLCGCNKEVVINDTNLPLHNTDNLVEEKQDENIENEKLKDDTNKEENNNTEKKETQMKEETEENQTTTSKSPSSSNSNTNNKEEVKKEDNSKNEFIYNDNLAHLDIYYQDTCSYCHKLFEFLDGLDENIKSKFIITKYNINAYNKQFTEAVKKFSGNVQAGTPYTVFNNQKAIMGYSTEMEQQYLDYIYEFSN